MLISPIQPSPAFFDRGNETPLSRETCMQEKAELEQREEQGRENRRAILDRLMLTSRKRTLPQEYK
jgi:hypothetical protein